MMKYGKAYGGADPELIEGDVFRIIVKVPEFGVIEETHRVSEQVAAQSGAQSAEILKVLGREPHSAKQLVDVLGLKFSCHNRQIDQFEMI